VDDPAGRVVDAAVHDPLLVLPGSGDPRLLTAPISFTSAPTVKVTQINSFPDTFIRVMIENGVRFWRKK
jgi:hypothetical protein